MLYSGKGDDGKTSLFGCDQRLSKGAKAIEALGSLDELNAFLGWCKVEVASGNLAFVAELEGDKEELSFKKVLETIQQDLFVLQAELAGADKKMSQDRLAWLEFIIQNIDKHLPPIKSFVVSGGTRISAMLDVARTLARTAERRVVESREEGKIKIEEIMISYLNRLSSVLYALARLANSKAGIEEEKPSY